MIPFILILIVMFYMHGIPQLRYLMYSPKQGDIIFQNPPKTDMFYALKGMTYSDIGHVGVVVHDKGKWYVIEAYEVKGKVSKTPLYEVFFRSIGYQFAVGRLRESYQKQINDFVTEVKKYLGRPYDMRFKPDDSKLYMTELIHHSFKNTFAEDVAPLQKIDDLSWESYDNILRRYEGDSPAIDRLILTPVQLYKSDKLMKVLSIGFKS